MREKECVAMLLAGGEGRRLGALTRNLAKPAVHFGGKYRIIDFTLSNCTNSGIDTVGVLTQYQPLVLNSYIGIGSPWDLDRKNGGVSVLPPFMEQKGGDWYKGTANAIYRNMGFIEQYNPKYVLVISGDHIYKMNYDLMLQYHKQKKADATIAVIKVKWEEASRFGIMSTGPDQAITEFAEKPKQPKSNLASMGIYIFTWEVLKSYLIKDEQNADSSKDFGKDVIPLMLKEGARMFAYPFQGYWKDVGTIESLWEANMDLLDNETELNLNDKNWRIYSVNPYQPAQYIAPSAQVRRSLVNEGCCVFGEVEHSVLFYGVQVGEGSRITDSVIMPNARIGANVTIHKAIIGDNTVVEDGAVIRGTDDNEIVLIGAGETIRASITSERMGLL
jgi:glucose-1-phosphate adenylyltransferase